jgi:hypothetical protein
MYRYFRFYKFNGDNGYIHHSLRLFGVTVWSFYKGYVSCWFRIFGKGLYFSWGKLAVELYQTYGSPKHIKIGKFLISNVNN